MKTLLLTVTYTDGTGVNGKGEFWADSYIKNKLVDQKDGESIHDTVKRVIEEEDYAELSYKGKPVSNIYVDNEEGRKIAGYIYRVKHTIEDRSNNFSGLAYFDAWVSIECFEKKEIELIDIEV